MSDSRFAALANDPRYRIPNRKKSRTAVDSRFKGLFSDQNFQKNATVDRYGRKIKSDSGKKDLETRFQLEGEDENDEEDDEDEQEDVGRVAKLTKGKPLKGAKVREVVGSSDESDFDDDEEDGASDAKVSLRRDPARDGGFSESSSEEESSEDEDEESEGEAELAEQTAGQEQDEDIPMGEVSRRIAAVNLDWDNIRAADIMAVASSFVPKNGRVERVTIYPSEFGKERLEREELEGPPREIFASSKRDDKDADEVEEEEEDSEEEDEKIKQKLLKEQAGDSEEFDTAKLRQYQLERLRYYYAVLECDTATTAKALYDSMDGREYLSTANFFDLRFIPDETSFDDDKPHEQCETLPSGYRPNDFKTEALTHSKVRLTWDDDDATRKEVQRRAFSRAEMDEEDLKAYIGSDSSEAESVSSRKSSTAETTKARKKELQREKMRAALGLPAQATKASSRDKDEPVGDMQITFTSGLSGNKAGKGVFENEPQDEESTRARYIRKERERKQRRKEKMKASKGDAVEDEAPEKDSDDEVADPFDDPFFNDPAAASRAEAAAKKAEKRKKREEQEAREQEAEARKAELDLLMAEDQQDNLRHFNMNEIKKAEKDAKRKGKKGKKRAETADVDDFKVETEDPRFKKLFESHEFAIDPSNKLYTDTRGMRDAVEEGRKKRKMGAGLDDGEGVRDDRQEKRQGKKARRARV